jgi:Tfp pilus assembly PilM family ATPase
LHYQLTSFAYLANIVQMLRVFSRKPSLGIEITSTTVRLAAVSGKSPNISIGAVKTAELPAGKVCDVFSSPNSGDLTCIIEGLRACLPADSLGRRRRAGLSLPDALFRVQLLEFDELPASPADQERLIRWRLEKAAAFDLSGTVLRCAVHRREPKGYAALVCVAKQAVVEQYERAFSEVGLEPWSIGISSIHSMNFYAPLMEMKTPVYAFTYIMDDSFAIMVVDRGRMKFYRWKEVKRGASDELKAKFIRELSDSIHFYAHMDRTQTTEIPQLYATGDSVMTGEIAAELADTLSFNVTALSPADIISRNGRAEEPPASLSAALGAGCAV